MKKTAKREAPALLKAGVALNLWAVWSEILPKKYAPPKSLLKLTEQISDDINTLADGARVTIEVSHSGMPDARALKRAVEARAKYRRNGRAF